ncbi:hypothetical protein GO003_020950 [Methylicorpusculum oleiharenae]|uniref:hypothetical protein n=1 Tax=Methylicorpusculum oleiharenae TaxID=1338687 RepID=UPI001358405E|nr:hypothetical protein [Methylicorpusculum oleiharenae]MCD2452856.1 hypothetical protein [Methylicorpusculum oleiharenae]
MMPEPQPSRPNQAAQAGQFKPLPHWLLLGGIVLSVLVMSLLGGLLSGRLHKPAPDAQVAVETPVAAAHPKQAGQPLAAPNKTAATPAPEAGDKPVAASSPNSDPLVVAAAAAAPEPTAMLTQDISALKAALADQLRHQQEGHSQQATQLAALQQQLTAQASQLAQLDRLLNETAAKAKPHTPPKPKASGIRKEPATVAVPFQLVSIDQWGETHVAVLRQGGQLHEKTTGQTLQDWQLIAINPVEQTLSVKSPAGFLHTLAISTHLNSH